MGLTIIEKILARKAGRSTVPSVTPLVFTIAATS